METSQSEHAASLEIIPPEVIEIIAATLSVEDLVACCGVSHRIRDVFGGDNLWKRYCDPELAEYLTTTPCKVNPPFVSPETEDSTLSPIGSWRLAFMRENHLWNNWRQGKYKKEELKEQKLYGFKNSPITHQFITNDIVLSPSAGVLEIFDLKEFPFKEVIQPIPLPVKASSLEWQINIMDNNVVAIFSSNVQVYDLDYTTGLHSLKYTFFFEESEKLNIKEVTELEREFETRNIIPLFRGFRIVEGKFFVGVLLRESILHVWNLEKGIKLKVEDCPTILITDSVEGSGTNNLIMSIRRLDTDSTTFVAYSLTDLAYLPFKVKKNGLYKFVIHKEHIGIYCHNSIEVYDYLTSMLLISYPTNHMQLENLTMNPQFIGDNLLFVSNTILKLFDPVTKCVHSYLTGVKWFTVISKKFVHAITHDGVLNRCEINPKNLFLFKIRALPLGKDFPFTVFGTLGSCRNQASTRCFIQLSGMGSILHFW
uniref:F-box domain-containing protein n=1 Tax=Cuerna arida TaxID=1464854 RepID=A0A1B6GZF8_9HEMI